VLLIQDIPTSLITHAHGQLISGPRWLLYKLTQINCLLSVQWCTFSYERAEIILANCLRFNGYFNQRVLGDEEIVASKFTKQSWEGLKGTTMKVGEFLLLLFLAVLIAL
jgi:hypothetical protein